MNTRAIFTEALYSSITIKSNFIPLFKKEFRIFTTLLIFCSRQVSRVALQWCMRRIESVCYIHVCWYFLVSFPDHWYGLADGLGMRLGNNIL